MVSRVQKIFFLCLFVSAAFVVREIYICVQTPRDQLPRDHDSFLVDWCRLQRSRVDWKGLLGNCRNKMAWKQRQVNSINRTDANKSFISRWEIKPQGDFSRFFIQTVTSNGLLKRTGGDSWRVHIRQGPASLAPMVIDHNDGTYEVIFLAVEPGNYSAEVFLDFTLCDGFRDPPEDWYIRGDVQGRKQENGALGYIDDDFIKAPLQSGTPLEFYIRESSKNSEFHNRVEEAQSGRKKLQTLMVYGDSIGVHYHALARKRPLCREMFRTCNKKYMWTYDASWKGNDNKDFNQSIVLEEIRKVFGNPNMKRKDSVFLFNAGVHYLIPLNFTTYQLLIDNIIKMLGQQTGSENKEKKLTGKALSIWRTNTALEGEHFLKFYHTLFNYTECRFFTNARVQLYHTYATNAMCKAGIPVLDMYPLTAAWPSGTRDSIHYTDKPMEPAIEVLERFLAEHMLKS